MTNATACVPRRIGTHVGQGEKKFDRYATIYTSPERAASLEATLIAMFRPKYNIAGVPLEA